MARSHPARSARGDADRICSAARSHSCRIAVRRSHARPARASIGCGFRNASILIRPGSGAVLPAELPWRLWPVFTGLIAQGSIWYPINLLAGVVIPGMGQASTEQLKAFNGLAFAAAFVGHGTISILVGLVYAVILPMFPEVRSVLGRYPDAACSGAGWWLPF